MKNYFGRIVILVKEYDESLNFYRNIFGCRVLYDQTIEGHRYLHLGFDSNLACGIWLLKATGEIAEQRIGNQTAGEPLMVIYTDSLDDVYRRVKENKVSIKSEPVTSSEYSFFQCFDLYGNEIVVTELKKDKNN